MYQHTREPDPLWQVDLERLTPRGGRANWLKIHWFAGWSYEPVQRWMIYEMVSQHIPSALLDDLKGLSPRDPSNGVWIDDHEVPGGKRWHCHSSVNYDQWVLYQETQCLAFPVWIIQGDKGGHVYRLSQAHMGFLEAEGIVQASVPDPGGLPYADYSQKTFLQLAAMDKLRQWKHNLSWEDRMTRTKAGLWVQRDRVAEEQEYNRALSAWLDEQVESAVSNMSRVNLPGLSDLPPGDTHYNEDEDEVEREFVEDTASTYRR